MAAKTPSLNVPDRDDSLLYRLRASGSAELLILIRAGLAFRYWEYFVRETALSQKDALSLARMKARTLNRRKKEGKLSPDESDRLIMGARIFDLALNLFEGDREAARGWLTSPQIALGGETPIEYASTDLGVREVEALIGRLEHGVAA